MTAGKSKSLSRNALTSNNSKFGNDGKKDGTFDCSTYATGTTTGAAKDSSSAAKGESESVFKKEKNK